MYSRSREFSLRPPSRWLAPRAYYYHDWCYPFSPSTRPPRSGQAAGRKGALLELPARGLQVEDYWSLLLWGSLRRWTWEGDGGAVSGKAHIKS